MNKMANDAKLTPGMPVWVIERDEDGNACEASGYILSKGEPMAEYIERESTLHRMKVDIRPPFAVVADMPAADVAPVVHGRWILVDTEKWIGVCSNCNRQDRIDHLATHCRFCGAMMDLEV